MIWLQRKGKKRENSNYSRSEKIIVTTRLCFEIVFVLLQSDKKRKANGQPLESQRIAYVERSINNQKSKGLTVGICFIALRWVLLITLPVFCLLDEWFLLPLLREFSELNDRKRK